MRVLSVLLVLRVLRVMMCCCAHMHMPICPHGPAEGMAADLVEFVAEEEGDARDVENGEEGNERLSLRDSHDERVSVLELYVADVVRAGEERASS